MNKLWRAFLERLWTPVSGTLSLVSKWLTLAAGIVLLVGMVSFRLNSYGPRGESMSTMDTSSYLDSARLPTFSYEFLTSLRSPAYPLLFKILGPLEQYQVTKISEPFFHSEGSLVKQPGFDRVVNFQMWVSILCWSFLAGVLFFRLRNGWVRLFGAGAVLLFGFSPQMADWDSLIMTESLTFSLFALLLGLMIELGFCLTSPAARKAVRTWVLLAAIMVVTLFWIFLRDSSVYIIPVILVFLLALAGWYWRKWKEILLPAAVFLVLMTGMFTLQQVTFRASERWLLPFYNNVSRGIFPYPQRVAFFQQYGMPVSKELLAIRGSQPLEAPDAPAAFVAWARQNGLTVYTRFIVEHPGSVLLPLWEDMESLWATNVQPYFYQQGSERPAWLIPVGNYLNPTVPLPILVDGLLTLLLVGAALQQRRRVVSTWAWAALWLYSVSAALLVLGYAGEMRSVLRHVMEGVVPLRLGVWVLLAVTADVMLAPQEIKKIE